MRDDNAILWWGMVLAFVLMFGTCSGAWAIPHVYIDSITGDDANPGTNQLPVRTWGRVLELLGPSTDCETGVKWDNDYDTPPVEIAEQITRKKHDKTEKHDTAEVVSGHGQLPSLDEVNSVDNGWGIRRRWTWLTFENAQGIQEYCAGVVDEVFAD